MPPKADKPAAATRRPRSSAEEAPYDAAACEQAARIFDALGDASRLRIVTMLAVREMCVSDITAAMNDNLSAVSQRLKLLRSERIVRTRREGKHIFYALADDHVAELVRNALDHASEQ